jgi:hypothetical protein
VTSTVKSLDASRDITDSGLKLDIHKRFEDSKTLLLLEDGLSEDIQNYLEPVLRKDVSLVGKSLKNEEIYVSDSKAAGYNMMFN